MKENPDFNIGFIKLVKAHRCLFDKNDAHYSDKRAQGKAWNDIAKKVTATSNECVQRWINLRACYTRYLKLRERNPESFAANRRPYYLAEHLKFLNPFLSRRSNSMPTKAEVMEEEADMEENTSEGVYNASVEEDDEEVESEEEEEEEAEFELQEENVDDEKFIEDFNLPEDSLQHLTETQTSQEYKPKLKRLKYSENNNDTESAQNSESIYYKNGSTAEKDNEDPDLLFLKSLQSEMHDMNKRQKRLFKVGILQLATKILSDEKK